MGSMFDVDADALIRQVVTKLQSQSNVEAERMHDGIRSAITILQGLVDGRPSGAARSIRAE